MYYDDVFVLLLTLQESQTCKTIRLLQQFLVWASCRKSYKGSTIAPFHPALESLSPRFPHNFIFLPFFFKFYFLIYF